MDEEVVVWMRRWLSGRGCYCSLDEEVVVVCLISFICSLDKGVVSGSDCSADATVAFSNDLLFCLSKMGVSIYSNGCQYLRTVSSCQRLRAVGSCQHLRAVGSSQHLRSVGSCQHLRSVNSYQYLRAVSSFQHLRALKDDRACAYMQ